MPHSEEASVADLVITGLGPVGPLGVGIDEWRRSFELGVSAVAPVDGAAKSFAATMGRLRTRPYADPKKWRQMSELGKQCVAATRAGTGRRWPRLDEERP